VAPLLDHWAITQPGWTDGVARLSWHLTFRDAPSLARAAARARPVLAGYDWLDPVEPRGLHLTLGTHVPDLSDVEPFVLELGPPVLWRTGVMLEPRPSAGLAALLEAFGVREPHVTLAYANREAGIDGEALVSELGAVVGRPTAFVDAVDLVWLRRVGRRYAWDVAERVRLGENRRRDSGDRLEPRIDRRRSPRV
jgi:hypothetical protein